MKNLMSPVTCSSELFHIMLIEPQDSLNVGSVARAMMNLGFKHLHLIRPHNFSLEKALVPRNRSLEVVERRLKEVVGGKFIDSLHGIDELRNRWRSLKVGDTLSLHDVLD